MEIPPHLLVYHLDGRLERTTKHEFFGIVIMPGKGTSVMVRNVNHDVFWKSYAYGHWHSPFFVHSAVPNDMLKARLNELDQSLAVHRPSQDWYEHVRTLWKSPVHCVTRKVMEFYFGG
jgi:hypothetical protein